MPRDVALQGYVVKHIFPREHGESDASWAKQKRRSERAIEKEADMLLFARVKGAKFAVQIEGLLKVDGSLAIVMEHAGEK